jgi:hypothetical protein
LNYLIDLQHAVLIDVDRPKGGHELPPNS